MMQFIEIRVGGGGNVGNVSLGRRRLRKTILARLRLYQLKDRSFFFLYIPKYEKFQK